MKATSVRVETGMIKSNISQNVLIGSGFLKNEASITLRREKVDINYLVKLCRFVAILTFFGELGRTKKTNFVKNETQ